MVNYAELGLRILPGVAEGMFARDLIPTVRTPGAMTPSASAPKPGDSATKAGSNFPIYSRPVEEGTIEVTPYSGTGGDGSGSIRPGSPFPGYQAKPLDLTVQEISLSGDYNFDSFAPLTKSYETGFKGWLSQKLDERLGPNYSYNKVTGRVGVSGLGVAIGAVLPSPLGTFASAAGQKTYDMLQDIAASALKGEEGYSVGMIDGKAVGVSPGLFGGSVLTGYVPSNITAQQRRDITNQLLALKNKSGAYVDDNPDSFALDEDAAQADPAGISSTTYANRPYGGKTTNVYGGYSPANDPQSETGGGGGMGYDGSGGMNSGYRASGGPVGFAKGGTPKKDPIQRTGFVEGPPQEYAKGTTVADTENLRVREGSFVINAPTTERLQKEGKLPKGPQKRKAAEGGKMMEVALSKGEYVVDANDIDKFGGYDALTEENDKGKTEVNRRQAKMGGSFLNGYARGDITLPERSPVRKQIALKKKEDKEVVEQQLNLDSAYDRIKNRFSSVKEANKEIDAVIDALPSEDVLAFMMLREASILGKEGMRASGHVAMNRVESDYKDFAKITDLAQMAKAKTKKGSYQFNVFNISDFRKGLKDLTQTEFGKKAYQEARDLAENIFYGTDEDNTRGALFFRNPATSTSADFENKVRNAKLIPTLTVQGKKSSQEYYRPIELMSDEDTRYIY